MSTLINTSSEKARYKGLLKTIGKNTLHTLFPKDFEAYLISFELVDSKNVPEAFLTFPVQPDSINEAAPRITNIKQTAGGIVAISTNNFVPRDIEIKGNFGRNLRFLIGNKFIQGNLFSFIRSGDGLASLGRPSFSTKAKTGYGVVKSLEDIFDAAENLDVYGKPRKLYFYNTILGNNYIVKPKSFIHSQNIGENMIPQYTINLTAVSPLDQSIIDQALKLGKSLLNDVLNKETEAISKSIGSTLGLL